tara:strand:- start:296 stop:673 length:378 start_codon:yes stop_codon:yes gene_type:complete
MSQNLSLSFDNEINTSVQIGDNVFAIASADRGTIGGFNHTNLNSAKFVGVITYIQNEVSSRWINVYQDLTQAYTPSTGSFIMFSKNKMINTSGLSGYFAEVEFTNNSIEYAELFSVGSQISESSK